jgi:PPE-repeat protein
MNDDELFSTFMSQYADNPYEQDLGTPLDAMDNETAKFYRQQALAQSDESPLAGMGTGAGTFDLPKVNATGLDKFLNTLKGMGGKALDFAGTNQGIMAILAAIAAAADRQRAGGGGTRMAYAGPTPVTRTMTQGKYGPIARYAANGGLMQAYAQGGQVQMEDGGFVMTKKAVDGAGGPRGLASLVPGARMIGGPSDPTGRKDLTPAVIHGPNGQTPAKVSRGEAYVPKRVVNQNGGSQEMYALMNSLQRRA